MRKVPKAMATRPKAAQRTLPDVRRPVASRARRAEPAREAQPDPAGSTGPRRAGQRAAFARIVEAALKRGWGFRVSAVGKSGSGKSYFEKLFLEYVLSVGAADLVLVYDHKDPTPAFEGRRYHDVAAFDADPPGPDDPMVAVFHDDGPGDPEEVARLGMELAGSGFPTLTIIDELFPDAVTEGGQGFRDGNSGPQALLLRTGRSRRASVMFGTQLPQQMPSAIIDLCESQVVFQLQGRGLDYVDRTRRIPSDAIPIVKSLELGQCILIVDGAWDGTIYGPAL